MRVDCVICIVKDEEKVVCFFLFSLKNSTVSLIQSESEYVINHFREIQFVRPSSIRVQSIYAHKSHMNKKKFFTMTCACTCALWAPNSGGYESQSRLVLFSQIWSRNQTIDDTTVSLHKTNYARWTCRHLGSWQPTWGMMFDPGIRLNAKVGESAWTWNLFHIWRWSENHVWHVCECRPRARPSSFAGSHSYLTCFLRKVVNKFFWNAKILTTNL